MNADDLLSRLITCAIEAKERAYCPYSHFRVGAAVLCQNDTIVTGCNVENCSYGVGLCAEQVAVAKAVADGQRRFKAIAVSTDCNTTKAPCGRCRQFLIEFGDMDLYLVNKDGSDTQKLTVESLLPRAFTPRDLS
uniref:Cytidine deaminase n=1 Tax=Trichuris muris TaxID=70415 RepID=A0A5S6QAY8_TRIMR